MAGIATPSINVISAVVIHFVFFKIVSQNYFGPEFLQI